MNFLATIEKLIARFSLVGDREFFDPALFPWVREVEKCHSEIEWDLRRVLTYKSIPTFQHVCPDQASITNDDGWKTFFFYAYGERNEDNCSFCADTDEALQKIPGMVTAFFSILEPGKHIPTHRGPYKGVLRYHLALRAVPGEAAIRVGGHERAWVPGESLIFDDTYPHEAWNRSVEQRVILFVDFLRPLPFPLNLLNKAVVRYIRSSEFVQVGVRRLNDWKVSHG